MNIIAHDNKTTTLGTLFAGKRGIIMGLANDHSIAWGIASALHAHGAHLYITAQEIMQKRVAPLASKLNADYGICDVEQEGATAEMIDRVGKQWGSIDFLVHAIAWADRSDLKGRYCDTNRDNFTRTMLTSCFSFTEATRSVAEYMSNGGSVITLTYEGARKVYPSYNVMGLAKAALESSVRYLAVDFGKQNIRVNAISAGPMRTLAASGIGSARRIMSHHREASPLGRSITLADVGGSAVYLLSDLSAGVTGEIHSVDAGYSITAMPQSEDNSSN